MWRLSGAFVLSALSVGSSPAYAQSGHVFFPAEQFDEELSLEGIATIDLNGDEFDDIVAVGGSFAIERALHFYESGPTGLTKSRQVTIGGGALALGDSIGVADFNGDGRVDIVVTDTTQISYLPQAADGTFGPKQVLSGPEVGLLRVGDFNDDGLMDVVSIDWGTQTVEVYSQGAGGLGAPASHAIIHEGYEDLDVGDVDGDGKTDIVVMSGQGLGEHVGVLLQRPGGFAPAIYASDPNARNVPCMGVGDLTGDGRDEIVLGADSFGLGGFTVTEYAAPVLGTPDPFDIRGVGGDAAEVADLTADGLLDILFVNNGLVLPIVQATSGELLPMESSVGYGTSLGRHAVTLGDLDGDGKVDVALPGLRGVSVLYGTAVALSVSAAADPDPVVATLTTELTAVIRNDGPDEATEVVVGVVQDTELRAGTLSSSQGDCDFDECQLGAIAAGASATITIEARPEDIGTFGADFSLSAYNFDADSSDDSTRATVTVLPAADLAVGLAKTYRSNGSVDGVLAMLSNGGPHESEGVELVVELDGSLTLAGFESTEEAPGSADGCTADGDRLVCTVPRLAESDLFSQPPAPQIHLLLSGEGTVRATVSAETDDPDASNNTAEFALTRATGTAAEADVQGPGAPGAANDDGGCGCRMTPRTPTNAAGALLVFALASLRRRRRASSSARRASSTPSPPRPRWERKKS